MNKKNINLPFMEKTKGTSKRGLASQIPRILGVAEVGTRALCIRAYSE